ncbi:succinate dehydrogenase assembly factor 2 [Boseongicola aestuarii]|uniref:FAD assembly factor SdhE n=1 Tax=Boseongicola aestuarii TaxID=1470561 RepID=A0A238IW01_9RHOB|nr:succinate dehydrogenase assembly factor 2 [Boseongicola aestuarii]SMX22668.1 hypothetical protein BOA8489_00766 [Boseongicola aestuarii]
MSETREVRLKRLRIRSWRRGMREMDMLLGPFSDGPLSELSDAELDIYEQLLAENDQEIYRWISAQEETPEQYQGLIRAVLLGAPSV